MSDGYVHLKSAKEKPNGKPVGATQAEGPEYPYGTRVRLSDDHVKKLYGDNVPDVGSEHEIHAKGKITESTDRDGEGRNVEIQITHMKQPAAKQKTLRDDVSDAAEMAEKKQATKTPGAK